MKIPNILSKSKELNRKSIINFLSEALRPNPNYKFDDIPLDDGKWLHLEIKGMSIYAYILDAPYVTNFSCRYWVKDKLNYDNMHLISRNEKRLEECDMNEEKLENVAIELMKGSDVVSAEIKTISVEGQDFPSYLLTTKRMKKEEGNN